MSTLNNPRSAERDNQNSLRKFPFSDASSCTNGACVIPPGAIIDAQLYVPGREPGAVWLSSVGTDGKLYFSDSKGVFAETSAPIVTDMAIPVVFTGDGGPCPGGVIVCGRAAEVSALRAYGGQKFTRTQAELAPAAVAWPGLPGVLGFRLDDGHVVYGAVKMKGANGLVVATYVEDGVSKLRLSAVGRTVETVNATGFITQVVAESDNRHFVLSWPGAPDAQPDKVITLTADGANLTQDDGLPADGNDLCARVRKTLGTKPSSLAAGGTDCVCKTGFENHTLTLMDGDTELGTMTAFQGRKLGTIPLGSLPTKAGKHFVGYFDVNAEYGGNRYFRHDGTGVGRFTAGADVTLYARFIDDSSRVEINFSGYGTLHISAQDALGYTNPISISGNGSPIPTVKEIPASALIEGGADALAEAVLHPSVPSGEVHIGLRGLGKAVST